MTNKVITKEAIKNFRKSLKLTQKQFAAHMGVTTACIKNWEQNNNKITKIPKRLYTDPRTSHLAGNYNAK